MGVSWIDMAPPAQGIMGLAGVFEILAHGYPMGLPWVAQGSATEVRLTECPWGMVTNVHNVYPLVTSRISFKG